MTDVLNETWLTIPNTNGLYEVSDAGNVRRTRPIRALKPSVDSKGYLRVNLSVGGKVTCKYVAHLVAENFIGERPHKNEVRHLDGNPMNNTLSNLTYGTKSDNMQDALRHGTFPVLERRPGAVLDRVKVVEIFQSADDAKTLAARYGVGVGVIRQIKLRETWRSVTNGLPDAQWNAKPKHSEEVIKIAIDRRYSREEACRLTGLSLHQIKRLRKMNGGDPSGIG